MVRRRWVDRDVICMSAVYALFSPPCKRLTRSFTHSFSAIAATSPEGTAHLPKSTIGRKCFRAGRFPAQCYAFIEAGSNP